MTQLDFGGTGPPVDDLLPAVLATNTNIPYFLIHAHTTVEDINPASP